MRCLFPALLALACSKKETSTEAKPEPTLSSSMKAAPSPPPVVVDRPIRFKLEKEFELRTSNFDLGSAWLFCQFPCEIRRGPNMRMWLVTPEGIEENGKLWPGHAWQDYLAGMEGEGYKSIQVHFSGDYPKIYATAYTDSRTGEPMPALAFQRKYWAVHTGGYIDPSTRDRTPPRGYDAALLTAPVDFDPTKALAFGGSGPTLLVSARKLHVFEAGKWTSRDAPFGNSPRAVRLADGATLVLHDDGMHVVDAKLGVKEVELQQKDPSKKLSFIVLGKSVRVLDDGLITRLYLPAKASNVEVFARPPREPESEKRKLAAAPVVSQQTTDAAADAANSAAVQNEGGADAGNAVQADPNTLGEMPPLVAFTEACSTPFVMLATPPHLGTYYETTGRGLAGHHELAPLLTFVEFKRGKTNFFGAQAKDEAAARKLMEVIKARIPAMKPRLGCLDAVGHIGDPYTAPKEMRMVPLHLGSGVRLRLP